MVHRFGAGQQNFNGAAWASWMKEVVLTKKITYTTNNKILIIPKKKTLLANLYYQNGESDT